MKKAIRMKTTRQLKEIFDELGIAHKGLDKAALQKVAYKENAVQRWEKLHPEKKAKAKKASGGRSAPPENFGPPPDGTDPKRWEDMMRQMRGDFSGEPDAEKRRILAKLAAKGMSFGGGANMDLEQLRNMEKMMDGINMGGAGMGGMGGMGGGMPDLGAAAGAAGAAMDSDSASTDEGAFDDDDKMEL